LQLREEKRKKEKRVGEIHENVFVISRAMKIFYSKLKTLESKSEFMGRSSAQIFVSTHPPEAEAKPTG